MAWHGTESSASSLLCETRSQASFKASLVHAPNPLFQYAQPNIPPPRFVSARLLETPVSDHLRVVYQVVRFRGNNEAKTDKRFPSFVRKGLNCRNLKMHRVPRTENILHEVLNSIMHKHSLPPLF